MALKHQNWVIATLLAASSLTIMSSATIAPSLPQISEVFKDAPYADVLSRIILTIPGLFIAIGAPVAGYLIDKTGRKGLILIGLVFYAIAGSAGIYLNSLYGLLLSRALLGLAVSAIMTTSTTLIGDYFEGEMRNKFMGLQGATMALGGVIFIIIGGVLADISWRGPFYIYLFSVIIIPLSLLFIKEPEKSFHPGIEAEKEDVKVPSSVIALIFLTGLSGMVLFYLVPVQIPFYLKEFGDVSNTKVGIAIASSTLIGAIVSSSYQKIKKKVNFPFIYGMTFGFMAVGFFIIGKATGYNMVIAGLAVNGLGMGLMMPNGSTWLMAITPVRVRGRIVGGMTMAVFVGQFISPLISQPLVASAGIGGTFVYGSILTLLISGAYLISASRLDKLSFETN